MQHLPGPARFRRLDSIDDVALEGFSSGSDMYAREFDEIIASLRGDSDVPLMVLLMEGASGETLGVVGYRDLNLLPPAQEEIDAVVVSFIGTRSTSHGYRMEDGETLGGKLLRATIDAINADRDGSTPAIWTLVHRDNGVARRLFQRYGFEPLPADGDHSILFRPPGLPVPGQVG
jgi:ribosomal protein S18 acetylase RimI-like enzyme